MTATAPEARIAPPRLRTQFRLASEPAAVPQDREQKAVPDFGPERRREVRYPTCDAVEVSALDVAGFQVRGVLRDVSRNGLCVELGLPVDPGARLHIALRDETIILAAVCYCSKTAGSYRVGAVIKGVYQSSHANSGAPRKVHCNIWRVDPDTAGLGNPHQNHELARAIVNDTVLFAGARSVALASQNEATRD